MPFVASHVAALGNFFHPLARLGPLLVQNVFSHMKLEEHVACPAPAAKVARFDEGRHGRHFVEQLHQSQAAYISRHGSKVKLPEALIGEHSLQAPEDTHMVFASSPDDVDSVGVAVMKGLHGVALCE